MCSTYHPIVEHILAYGTVNSAPAGSRCKCTRCMWYTGYGETHGVPKIVSDFQSYCDYQDLKASQVKPTNEHINRFLDIVTGCRQPSDSEDSGKGPGCVEPRHLQSDLLHDSLGCCLQPPCSQQGSMTVWMCLAHLKKMQPAWTKTSVSRCATVWLQQSCKSC